MSEQYRTHCKYGHEFSGTNVLWVTDKEGNKWRQCKICKAQRVREYRVRVKAKIVQGLTDKLFPGQNIKIDFPFRKGIK